MPAATLTRAFDTAATAVAEQIRPLGGAAIHVNGASGFLASNLLALLECRLDNVLVRLGFGASRRQARQLIRHGHWTVNGRRVNIPSYQVRPGDVITIKADTPATQVVRDATELTGQIPAWLQADHESLTAKVLRKPERREVAAPVQEQLIVELYSK